MLPKLSFALTIFKEGTALLSVLVHYNKNVPEHTDPTDKFGSGRELKHKNGMKIYRRLVCNDNIQQAGTDHHKHGGLNLDCFNN